MIEHVPLPLLQLNNHVSNLYQICREVRFEHDGASYRVITKGYYYPDLMLFSAEIAAEEGSDWDILWKSDEPKVTEADALRSAVNWLDKRLKIGAFS